MVRHQYVLKLPYSGMLDLLIGHITMSYDHQPQNQVPEEQLGLQFAETNSQVFDHWHDSRGGRFLLREIFRISASYGNRYNRTGQRVSVKLIWEMVRDRLKVLKYRASMKGITIQKIDGYRMNNNLHPYVARLIVDRRPQWDGMFEMRERKTK